MKREIFICRLRTIWHGIVLGLVLCTNFEAFYVEWRKVIPECVIHK